MLLGCIGDDFTGSSDLANTLTKAGMRTTQYSGIPSEPAAPDVQAGVVSLKSRTIPVEQAIEQSLAALQWLMGQGCKQFFFKYCSTFDSTRDGNIGPVADALVEVLNAERVIFCPAFPGTGRSVYQGHLFVKDVLLNESGMQNHPLTPMVDADIRRWLAPQTKHSVGHVAAQTVFAGRSAIAANLDALHDSGVTYAIVDAIRDEDLMEIGAAVKSAKLVTGGSGVALGLPANFGCQPGRAPWSPQTGKSIALSGSCSIATRVQIKRHAQTHPAKEITAEAVLSNSVAPDEMAQWMMAQDGVPVLYSSAEPDVVANVQKQFGAEAASSALEGFFAEVARCAIAKGATRIITAGGETSGAIVEGLAVQSFEIGPEIDPGVPALRAGSDLVLALKSGNFGAEDFFVKADKVLAGDA